MREEACAIPTTTKLETPEGPLTIATIARSPVSVMTRTDDGEIRFAMTREARKIEAAQPVLRITLAGGRAFRVGSGQILLKKGMEEIRARDLQPGDQLETVFTFPEGYVYKTDDGEEVTSTGAIRVETVESEGEADAYSLRVHQIGRFAFSAGVLGKAEGS